MGQGRSKERYEEAVKKLSSLELANIDAVFDEIATSKEDGTKEVELTVVNRQEFAERFRLPGFVAERLFHAFDKNKVHPKACPLPMGINFPRAFCAPSPWVLISHGRSEPLPLCTKFSWKLQSY